MFIQTDVETKDTVCNYSSDKFNEICTELHFGEVCLIQECFYSGFYSGFLEL